MDWNELSDSAQKTMRFLGDFSPTSNVENKEIKGYMDGKCYLDSKDLREISADLIEVAHWLEKRASESVSVQRQVLNSDEPKEV